MNTPITITLRAQAMHFALLISAVIALLLSAFLLLVHSYSFFKIQSQEVLGMIQTSNDQFVTFSQEHTTPLLDTLVTNTTHGVIKSKSNYYGSWQKTMITTTNRSKEFKKAALMGTIAPMGAPNLYLTDTNSPLIVVGNTRIEGTHYLPKVGIKAGTIAGSYYQGNKLSYGKTHSSKKELPPLAPEWITYVSNALDGNFIKEEHVIALKDKMTQSFLKAPKIIYTKGRLDLAAHQFIGNLILVATSKITVSPATQLEDVVLVAPEISIKKGFKGTIHAIANKKITVASQCQLQFPSSLVVLETPKEKTDDLKNTYKKEPGIHLGRNTTLEGSVVYLKKKTAKPVYNGVSADILLDQEVQITGEVYCQGNTELLGTVSGALYTQQFVANQKGSIYLNHIYNGKIIPHTIAGYGGLPFANKKNTLVKWMY